jgi:hypothetical protein
MATKCGSIGERKVEHGDHGIKFGSTGTAISNKRDTDLQMPMCTHTRFVSFIAKGAETSDKLAFFGS